MNRNSLEFLQKKANINKLNMDNKSIDVGKLLKEMGRFESEKEDKKLPIVKDNSILDISNVIGMTSGKDTNIDYYNYFSCFFKIVHPNGDSLKSDLYDINVINQYKVVGHYNITDVLRNLEIHNANSKIPLQL